MAAVTDYYKVLGVSDKAQTDEIKRAYRRLAKKHHPDANPDDPKSGERFKEISEAHSVLMDPEKRKQYDLMRKYGAFAGGPSRSRPGGARQSPGPDFGGFEGFGGLGDLFSSIFGRGKQAGGADEVEVTASVPFKVAALGGKVPIMVPVREACPTCAGSGAAPGAKVAACAECKGQGQVTFGQGAFSVTRPCPACRGRGRVASEACSRCAGQGDVSVDRRVMVTVTPGTETGTKVRLKGEGQRGSGGTVGDVVVTFDVQPDRFLRRDGINLHCSIPVNLAQAILGTKIKVRTIDGKRVVLNVPAGTQPGRRFRIAGKGIERNGKRGDQFVEITVRMPEKLTEEQETLLRQFADAAGLKY
ncbi:MAG TPA: molecular chaperone DnaJ [Gemmatimonadales bacterium]